MEKVAICFALVRLLRIIGQELTKETPALGLLQKELLFHFRIRSDAVAQKQNKKIDSLSVGCSFPATYMFVSELFCTAQII
jgi:hypothetical protein